MVGKDLIMATMFGSGGGIPQADIDAAFAALAEKGVTVPDGATSADLDELIASIVTGGGGGISIHVEEQTPATDLFYLESTRKFTDGIPLMCIAYSAFAEKQEATKTSGHVCSVNVLVEKEVTGSTFRAVYDNWIWHYNTGASKQYAPYYKHKEISLGLNSPVYLVGVAGAILPSMKFIAGVTYKAVFVYGEGSI